MTDESPRPEVPPPPFRPWLITMSDKTTRTIRAAAFRVEGGALVLVLPAGAAAAYAPGIWLTVESAPTEQEA
jgi:hypothetical protein